MTGFAPWRALPATWAALISAAFVAAVFGLGADGALPASYDYRESLGYYKEIYVDALRAGRLPLWNPHSFGGWPFVADPETQVFYPPSVLYLLLPARHALVLDVAGHLLLGWLGTARWAGRALGLERGPAFFAGLAFACCGFFVARGYAGHLTFIQAAAYVPWLALAAHEVRAAIAAGAPRLAMRWTATGGLLLGLQLLTGGLPVAWLGAVALALFAVAALALAEPRARWSDWWRNALALACLGLLGVGLAAVQLLPSMELADLSNRPRGDYSYARTTALEPAWLALAGRPRAVLDLQAGVPWHEMYAYAGILVLALALAGFMRAGRDRRVLALLPAAIFMTVYALGERGFLHRWLFDTVPTFDLFRAPARALLVTQLVVALLAGVGLQALLTALAARTGRAAAWTSLVVAAACLLALADAVTAARWYRPALLGPGNEPAVAREQARAARRNAAALVKDESWYRYWASPGLLPQNYAARIDRRSVNGYAGLMPARYPRYIGAMTGHRTGELGLNLLNPRILAEAPRFSLPLLGVKYELVRGQFFERPGGPDVPRAWFVAGVRRVADGEAALAYMRSPRFRPRAEAVLEPEAVLTGDRPADDDATPIEAIVRELAPERLLIEAGPREAGLVVLSELYYPGWRATLAGRELPVLRCNYVLRCVRLPGGSEGATIEMRYLPASLRLGAVLSIGTLVILGIMLRVSRD